MALVAVKVRGHFHQLFFSTEQDSANWRAFCRCKSARQKSSPEIYVLRRASSTEEF